MILNENDAKRLLTKVLQFSRANSISLALSGSNIYNLRFALNSLSTNGYSDSLNLSITSNIGKKSGSVSLSNFSDESIKEAVKKSEKIAEISPDNKEFMPPLSSQTYIASNNYFKDTEIMTSEKRAEHVAYVMDMSAKKDLISAGYFENSVSFLSLMNSNGLFAYNLSTDIEFSSTVRTKDGTGSSRMEKNYVDINKLNSKELSDIVIDKSIKSANPQEIPPGKYTVILEPAAVADVIANCMFFMNSRPADEGRSFFSKKEGGNKIGEMLADSRVNIFSDPADINAPSTTFNSEGIPRNKVAWFENGALKNLHRSRYWAEKTSQPVIPFPSNIIMEGTEKSLADLIASTDKGVLVTRLWYIRTVDSQTMLLTGLTRDGLFEIVDGKILRPVKNFRFNESPINILSNIVEIGAYDKATGSETGGMQLYVPALKIKNFNFSSLSDAI